MDPRSLAGHGRALPFAFRMVPLPLVVVVVLGALFLLGATALRTQQDAMRAVVETDLESSARLAQINSRLQTANTDMYRLITEAAAGGDPAGYTARIQDLSGRVEAVAADLRDYRNSAAEAQRPVLDRFIDDLTVYKGAIEWVGSMLEIDFKTSFAFISPYNAHVDGLSRQLSAIIAESTVTAKARAETASEALRRVAYAYVIAAVLVSILVSLFVHASGRRQDVLYRAARVKTEQVETLLDNSGQGFLSFGPDMVVDDGYSRACEEMFGTTPAGRAADELLFPGPDAADRRTLLRAVTAKALGEPEPIRRAIILSLLPGEIALGGKILETEYKALDNGSIMLVATDVTEARWLARQVERERRRLEIVVAAVSDSHDFFMALDDVRRFLADEVEAVLQAHAPTEALDVIYREIHTFKGTFNQFGFDALPGALHALEGRLQELRDAGQPPEPAQLRDAIRGAELPAALDADLDGIREVLGDGFLESRGMVSLPLEEFRRLEDMARGLARASGDGAAAELLRRIEALRKVSLKVVLADFDPLVRRIAERCGKEMAPLVVEGDDVLVLPEVFQPLFRALAHVFRNAVDHGVEPPEQRLAAGKDEAGQIRCTVTAGEGRIRIDIADDGAGIDVEALRARAQAAGLSPDPGVELIFADGISTRPDVSEVSGRGVGLAAVRTAVRRLGGEVTVHSRHGAGTLFSFTLPDRADASAEAA
ncbi:MAG: ATP-binding protein [Actinomycetota bacterium]